MRVPTAFQLRRAIVQQNADIERLATAIGVSEDELMLFACSRVELGRSRKGLV